MFPSMETTTELKLIAFRKGVLVGLREFAWWKDGTQYVGTCGRTLKEEIDRVDKGEYDASLS